MERLLDLTDKDEFQLVLVSATMNEHVRDYAMEVMEIDEASESFVTIRAPAKGEDGGTET